MTFKERMKRKFRKQNIIDFFTNNAAILVILLLLATLFSLIGAKGIRIETIRSQYYNNEGILAADEAPVLNKYYSRKRLNIDLVVIDESELKEGETAKKIQYEARMHQQSIFNDAFGSGPIVQLPKREGHLFKHWSETIGGEPIDPSERLSSDKTLYAVWYEKPELTETQKIGTITYLQEIGEKIFLPRTYDYVVYEDGAKTPYTYKTFSGISLQEDLPLELGKEEFGGLGLLEVKIHKDNKYKVTFLFDSDNEELLGARADLSPEGKRDRKVYEVPEHGLIKGSLSVKKKQFQKVVVFEENMKLIEIAKRMEVKKDEYFKEVKRILTNKITKELGDTDKAKQLIESINITKKDTVQSGSDPSDLTRVDKEVAEAAMSKFVYRFGTQEEFDKIKKEGVPFYRFNGWGVYEADGSLKYLTEDWILTEDVTFVPVFVKKLDKPTEKNQARYYVNYYVESATPGSGFPTVATITQEFYGTIGDKIEAPELKTNYSDNLVPYSGKDSYLNDEMNLSAMALIIPKYYKFTAENNSVLLINKYNVVGITVLILMIAAIFWAFIDTSSRRSKYLGWAILLLVAAILMAVVPSAYRFSNYYQGIWDKSYALDPEKTNIHYLAGVKAAISLLFIASISSLFVYILNLDFIKKGRKHQKNDAIDNTEKVEEESHQEQ